MKVYTPIVRSYLRKIARFIRLSLTLTKLHHIERDNLTNTKNCDISATVWPISTKFKRVTPNVYLKWETVKTFNFKIMSWQTAAILKIEKLQYLTMIQNGSLKRTGRPPSWLLKIKLNGQRTWDTFCIIMPCRRRWIRIKSLQHVKILRKFFSYSLYTSSY